uniref:B3/B4 tRNA-binding domain-containing protein n=1 Tax=Photinus pyralis TaxID=7054 RepID=A0A1Y1M253_PHOPY
MAWPEVLTAQNENRHEIILTGREISNSISRNGVDPTLFTLVNLNYLNIHSTGLETLPDAIEKLHNLQTLVLHSNKLATLNSKVAGLDKLKILDLSGNLLHELPDTLSDLSQLVTVNVSNNQLNSLPKFRTNSKLAVIDASNNNLAAFPDVCHPEMVSLAEIRCSNNKIAELPNAIGALSSLKVLLVNSNEIKEVPGELAKCGKLKDLNLKENPIADRRLLKLMTQGHTKKIIDYIKQHGVTTTVSTETTNKGKKGKRAVDDEVGALTESLYKVSINHCNDNLCVIVHENVKSIRPHLIACLVLNVTFTEEIFKKFIQLQTKLHDTLCEKRNVATIATHDAEKLLGGNLVYTALPPNDLRIKPLNGGQELTGAQLFKKLQLEAENLRKEKKRNTYSGIHKYLYMLEGKSLYACLTNTTGDVISFPPITNSELTKMTMSTTSLLIEVTGAGSQGACKKVADTLIKEMVPLFGGSLTIQQVKNVDVDGNLKSVYPSRTDLVFDDNSGIAVLRE